MKKQWQEEMVSYDDDELEPLAEPAPQFVFVSEQDQGSVRSHAMREHWKQRHHSRELKRRNSLSHGRKTARAASQPRRGSESVMKLGRASSSASSASPTKAGSPDHPAAKRAGESSRSGASGSDLGIPGQLMEGISRALSSARLDPFDSFPVTLTPSHHKLLHHWLNKYAVMLFEDVPLSTFNPMRDVCIPLDMSNAGSFNAVMAHSAAHLARMQGISCSEEALRYKMEAVRIVTQWMNDPERSISDDAFAAVLRLLSYERYWGTESEWRIHRYGLQRMVIARGGMASLEDNWRLKLSIYLVLLMSKPTWLDITNKITEISQHEYREPIHPVLGHVDNIPKVRSLWMLSFVQDLRSFMSIPSPQLMPYQYIQGAIVLLITDLQMSVEEGDHKMNHRYSDKEFARVACILYFCVLLQSVTGHDKPADAERTTYDSSSSHSVESLILIDNLLRDSKDTWQAAGPEGIYNTLYNGSYAMEDKEKKLEYMINLTNVLGQTTADARRGISKCLLHILHPAQADPHSVYRGDNWTPDSLLCSLQNV